MTTRIDAKLRHEIVRRMRVPIVVSCCLLTMLAVIVALGALVPSRTATYIELGILACMVTTVLLLSMEVRHEAPLTRFFAGLGFAWLGILFSIILLDYVTR